MPLGKGLTLNISQGISNVYYHKIHFYYKIKYYIIKYMYIYYRLRPNLRGEPTNVLNNQFFLYNIILFIFGRNVHGGHL